MQDVVTNEQEEYAQPFMDALNHLRNSDKAQLHPQQTQHNNLSEYTTAGTTGAIVANPAITTTSATTSTILSKVGMSGGSVTYTNLGNPNKEKKKNKIRTKNIPGETIQVNIFRRHNLNHLLIYLEFRSLAYFFFCSKQQPKGILSNEFRYLEC